MEDKRGSATEPVIKVALFLRGGSRASSSRRLARAKGAPVSGSQSGVPVTLKLYLSLISVTICLNSSVV